MRDAARQQTAFAAGAQDQPEHSSTQPKDRLTSGSAPIFCVLGSRPTGHFLLCSALPVRQLGGLANAVLRGEVRDELSEAGDGTQRKRLWKPRVRRLSPGTSGWPIRAAMCRTHDQQPRQDPIRFLGLPAHVERSAGALAVARPREKIPLGRTSATAGLLGSIIPSMRQEESLLFS